MVRERRRGWRDEVSIDCFIGAVGSSRIGDVRGHLSCLALSPFCRKIIRFSPGVGFIGARDTRGRWRLALCKLSFPMINGDNRLRSR